MKKVPGLYFKKWELKDCEPDIRAFEIDFGAHHNTRHGGFSVSLGSKFFGILDFTFVTNKKAYLRACKGENPEWIGKELI
jgi:hypothetical protein